jgi:hypothetical protein
MAMPLSLGDRHSAPCSSTSSPVCNALTIDILPLITVWLQVRVLPGPPAFARFGQANLCHEFQAKRAKAVTPKPAGRRRTGAASDDSPRLTKIPKTTPCKVAARSMLWAIPREHFDTSGKSAALFHRRSLRCFSDHQTTDPYSI